tara:strand:+ start:196 stop:408 length:213 start_codon:yes stop_codon:yes gene_type:complete
MKKIIIIGGKVFTGSHLVKYFTLKYLNHKIINFNIPSYASYISRLNIIENTKIIKELIWHPRTDFKSGLD